MMVPQFVILALVGAGLYVGYRWLTQATQEITADVKRKEDDLRRRAAILEKDMGVLEYDPATGVYRPKRQ
jgi:type II secretory pathway component PulJ